jgi:hypothetical protein
MKKITPKKKIYLTIPVFEMEVSYTYKGNPHKSNYVFDSIMDLELFAKEAVNTFVTKGFQNIHISLLRKEKHYDSQIAPADVAEAVKESKPSRKQRLENTTY